MTYTSRVDRVFVFGVIHSPHPPFASQIVPLLHGRRLSRALSVFKQLLDKLKSEGTRTVTFKFVGEHC